MEHAGGLYHVLCHFWRDTQHPTVHSPLGCQYAKRTLDHSAHVRETGVKHFFFSSVVARVWAHDVTAQGEGFVCQKHMRHRAKMFCPWEDGVIRDTQCVLP